MIRFARWLVRLEIGIWRSLFLWIFRRVPGKGPRSEDFSYAKEVTPLLIVFIFLSALAPTHSSTLMAGERLAAALAAAGQAARARAVLDEVKAVAGAKAADRPDRALDDPLGATPS